MKWHPDKNPSNKKEVETKFKQISEAYEVGLVIYFFPHPINFLCSISNTKNLYFFPLS